MEQISDGLISRGKLIIVVDKKLVETKLNSYSILTCGREIAR